MKCKFCGADLHDGAIFCENCGTQAGENAPRKKPPVKASTRIWQILGILFVVIFLWSTFGKSCDSLSFGIGSVSDAEICYEFAKEAYCEEILFAPETARFPAFDKDFVSTAYTVEKFEGRLYNVRTVTAYVDYPNSFGTMIRSEFQIQIGLPTDGEYDLYMYEIIYDKVISIG